MQFDLLRMTWCQDPHEVFCSIKAILPVNDDLIHVTTVEIAYRAFDDIALFIYQTRCLSGQCFLADFPPGTHQVVIVSANFGFAAF